MKAAKRRVLRIVDEIECFVWTGSPHESPPALLSSICRLIGFAERLRVAAAMLPHPRLQSILDSMDLEVDGTDMTGGHRLLAQLEAAGALIRDAYEDFGDDLANWKLECDRDAAADDSQVETLKARIAELEKKLEEPGIQRLRSYRRCILVMAIAKYGYRPGAMKQTGPKKIGQDAGSGRLKIGRETIRDILSESAQDLEIDQTEVDNLLDEIQTS